MCFVREGIALLKKNMNTGSEILFSQFNIDYFINP